MGYGLSALPIIAMTAQGQEEDKRQCFAAGMNDHMLKPLEPERLNAVLRHWLAWERTLPLMTGSTAYRLTDGALI